MLSFLCNTLSNELYQNIQKESLFHKLILEKNRQKGLTREAYIIKNSIINYSKQLYIPHKHDP
jgi:hypothetical protein